MISRTPTTCEVSVRQPVDRLAERDPRAFSGARRSPVVQSERMKLYQQGDNVLIEQEISVPVLHNRTHSLVRPWVTEFPTTPIRTCVESCHHQT